MTEEQKKQQRGASIVNPEYARGNYFADARRYSGDAGFKVENFLKIFSRFAKNHNPTIKSFIDVGCGSGDIIKLIADSLRKNSGFEEVQFKGYDVSPHVQDIKNPGIEYVFGDFLQTDECADMVTLFDVIEHVPDTIEFIKSIAARCKFIGFHIPLDYSFHLAMRDGFRIGLHTSGHLLFLDTASALNLLALSGLRVVDYEYTFGKIVNPSGKRRSLPAKLLLPLSYFLAKKSPWLLSRTLGGVSLCVIAITKLGLHEIQPAGT